MSRASGEQFAGAQAGLEFVDQILERAVKRGLLCGVVAKEGARRYAGRTRNFGHGRLLESALDEESQGGVVKCASGVTLAGLTASLGEGYRHIDRVREL